MGALNNIIVMNRGDTYEFDLTIDDETSVDGRYRLTGDDAVYFGLMDPGQPFEVALVRKKFTAEDADEMGNLIITISPEDTLDLFPGKYFYAIKLHLDHDDIDPNTGESTGKKIDRVVTVINKTKFIICD
jgi:hypothetical protein